MGHSHCMSNTHMLCQSLVSDSLDEDGMERARGEQHVWLCSPCHLCSPDPVSANFLPFCWSCLPCQALNLKLFNSRSVPKPVFVRSIFKMLPFGNRLDVRSASMMMDMIGWKSNLVFKCDFSHCHFDQVIKLDRFVQYLMYD